MITQDEMIRIFEYYAYTDGATYRSTADAFGKNFRTIADYIKNPPRYIAPSLLDAVDERIRQNLEQRATRGGVQKHVNRQENLPSDIAEKICKIYLQDGVKTKHLVRLSGATEKAVRQALDNPPKEYEEAVNAKRFRTKKKA